MSLLTVPTELLLGILLFIIIIGIIAAIFLSAMHNKAKEDLKGHPQGGQVDTSPDQPKSNL